MLAFASTPSSQLPLPPPIGDAAFVAVPPPPDSQVQARSSGPRRPRSAWQLWLAPEYAPPLRPTRAPKVGAVVRSVDEALAEYRRRWDEAWKATKKKRRTAAAKGVKAPPDRKPKPRVRPPKVELPKVEVATPVPLDAYDLASWDWSEPGRLVDGGAEDWDGWRAEVVEAAMARREASVLEQMTAAGGGVLRPRQTKKRTKAEAQAAATAALMAGKPGAKLQAKAAARRAASGAPGGGTT